MRSLGDFYDISSKLQESILTLSIAIEVAAVEGPHSTDPY